MYSYIFDPLSWVSEMLFHIFTFFCTINLQLCYLESASGVLMPFLRLISWQIFFSFHCCCPCLLLRFGFCNRFIRVLFPWLFQQLNIHPCNTYHFIYYAVLLFIDALVSLSGHLFSELNIFYIQKKKYILVEVFI